MNTRERDERQHERARRLACKLQRRAAHEASEARRYRDVEGWNEAAVLYQVKSEHSYKLAARHRVGRKETIMKPVVTIITTGSNVSSLVTEQSRYVCSCGSTGAWGDQAATLASYREHLRDRHFAECFPFPPPEAWVELVSGSGGRPWASSS